MSTPIDRILAAVDGATESDDGWMALCPAHDDHTPSLSIDAGHKGRVLLKCHAGCSTQEVVSAAGLTMNDLFPASNCDAESSRAETVYPYRDELGVHVSDVVRMEPKGFYQRKADGTPSMTGVRRLLYQLPELTTAVTEKRTVYVVEGEKDVHSLVNIGLVATTNPGGADKWRREYNVHFAGADVVIVPDNDDVGRRHAQSVAGHLSGIASAVRIVSLPGLAEKGDVSDWLNSGGTADQLNKVAHETPVLTEAPATRTKVPWPAKSSARTLRQWLENPTLLIPPKSIIPNFAVEGRVTLLSGREKIGKSTVVGSIVAAASHGKDVFGERLSKPVRTLIYSIDEPVADMIRRLKWHGADLDRVIVNDTPRTLGELLAALETDLAAHPEIDLVVLDTLSRVFAMTGVDPNSSREAEPLMAKLTDFFHSHNISAIYIYHTGKSGVEFRGSTAIGASVDEVITLRRRGKAKDVDDFDDDETIDGDRLLVMDGRNLRGRLRLTWVDGEYRRYDAATSIRKTLTDTLRANGTVKSRNALAELAHVRKADAMRFIGKLIDERIILENAEGLRVALAASANETDGGFAPNEGEMGDFAERSHDAIVRDSKRDQFALRADEGGSRSTKGPLQKREPDFDQLLRAYAPASPSSN